MNIFDNIETIIFDLDNTLYDHSRVQNVALEKTYNQYHDILSCITLESFQQAYIRLNEIMWRELVQGVISREELRKRRFVKILGEFGLGTSSGVEMSWQFLDHYNSSAFLIDGAREILDYTKSKYRLGMITNGFTEVQNIKLESLDISQYFEVVIMSQKVGVMKPDKRIFDAFFEQLPSAKQETSLFIGDSLETDIAGAKNAGMKTIWFNFENLESPENSIKPDKEISELSDILELL